ncbi:MAG TPA: flagellar hook-length control protein FliK [Burkholderiaceae bacterium]|jgi:flagellar hook-length control protein FliK|nr:flagellar hook-length control protein FliK [Burkholderiaceae bacterium]
MNPIRIAPSPSTSTAQTDAAASGSSESGADFGPILLAASGKAERPPAPRSPQPQGGSADPAQAAHDRAVASRGRRSSQTDSKGGNDTAAAAAAACTAAQGTQARSDTTPASRQVAGTAGAPADATGAIAVDPTSASGAAGRVTTVAAAAGAAGTVTTAAAAAGAAGTVTTAAAAAGAAGTVTTAAAAPAGQPAVAAADAAGAIAGPIGTRILAQAAAVGSADLQPRQPSFALRASEGEPASLAANDASTDADTGAAAGGDPSSSGFSAALPASVLAGGQDGTAALAEAAAAALASPASKPIDAAPAHAGTAAGAIASDAAGAPAAGPITPAPIYSPDGRTSVATPVNHPDFGQELSQRVVLLARGGVQTAQISLQPADLGPVGVSIQIHGHAATLAFTAAHEATRAALEASLPRLREAFAASGLQLSDATVGGRSHSDWTASARPHSPARGDDGGTVAAAPPASEPAPAPSAAAVRLVDIYA